MYERIDRWKLSEPIWLATTKAEPEQLEAMGPIRFETDADDLGEFKVGFYPAWLWTPTHATAIRQSLPGGHDVVGP